MYQGAAQNMPIGAFTRAGGRKRAENRWSGAAGRLIIGGMFRHAVFAWLAVAGLVAAAPARAAGSPAGCPLPGKRS
jgi:hypothetical protein